MSVLFVLLPLTLLISSVALFAFGWATRRGQFDDLETPALRALHDEVDELRSETPKATGTEPLASPRPTRAA